ncbi:MAG: hypothetical protein KAX49_02110 [Halanaerobiales bacterium]|nr:hypothetical protein [Halanaerobiales bacterium]
MISQKNFLRHFYNGVEIKKSLHQKDFPLVDMEGKKHFTNFAFLLELQRFFKSDEKNITFIYNPRFFSLKVFHRNLKLYFSNSKKIDDILFLEVNNFSQRQKTIRSSLETHFGVKLDILNEVVEKFDKVLLLVLNYEKIDQTKIERIMDTLHELESIPHKVVHLIDSERSEIFKKLNFKSIREFDLIEEYQILINIKQKIPIGKIDAMFLANDKRSLEVLQIPECLDDSIKHMQKKILGFSTVFRSQLYERILKKYFPDKNRNEYFQDVITAFEEQLRNRDLTKLDLYNITLQHDDIEFTLSVTCLLNKILQIRGWKNCKDEIEYLQKTYPDAYVWSNSLYLNSLIKAQKLDEFEEYLLWKFDEELLSEAFKHNFLFGTSSIAFIEKLTKKNLELGEKLQKIIIKDYLIYGFYQQGATLLSRLKKYFSGEQFDLIESFRSMLANIAKNTDKCNKFIEVEKKKMSNFISIILG